MAELPVELIVEILQRLPAKTLLRLKCVCKSMRDTIDSPNFIKSHLNTTSDHKKLIVRGIVSRSPKSNHPKPKFLVSNTDDPFRQLLYMPDEFPTEIRHLWCCRFFAHCDGLVLLGKDLYKLGVWNPSIRKYKRLPVLRKTKTWDLGEPIPTGIRGLGFGYDSSSDDYKILLIEEVHFFNSKAQLWIWILGLRSSFRWRKIETLPYIDFRHGIRNCFADGAFHFLCKDDTILTFDVAKETFSRIPLPNLGQTYSTALQVFEECLCVHFISLVDELHLIRKKDGVEFSWTNLFSITKPTTSIHWEFLGYSKEGENVFIFDNENSSLYSYYYGIQSLHRLKFGDDFHISDIIFCNKESLVSIDYKK